MCHLSWIHVHLVGEISKLRSFGVCPNSQPHYNGFNESQLGKKLEILAKLLWGRYKLASRHFHILYRHRDVSHLFLDFYILYL